MIRILHDFTGYPDGSTPRVFKAGETPDDLAADYEALLIAKGHAEPMPETRKVTK